MGRPTRVVLAEARHCTGFPWGRLRSLALGGSASATRALTNARFPQRNRGHPTRGTHDVKCRWVCNVRSSWKRGSTRIVTLGEYHDAGACPLPLLGLVSTSRVQWEIPSQLARSVGGIILRVIRAQSSLRVVASGR